MDERHAESKSYNSHSLFLIFLLGSEIPKLSVSKFGVLNGDDEVTIVCNVTQTNEGKSPLAGLKRISWFKDDFLVRVRFRWSVPNVPEYTLSSLLVRDGGNYTCVLEVLLRGKTTYKVSDYTVIKCEFEIGNGTQQ